MDETEWMYLACHHRLTMTARIVRLEYESQVRGLSPAKEIQITREGCWVWKPDADNILRLGSLASCRGVDHNVKRPFHTAQIPVLEQQKRPVGPPTN